MHLELEQKEGRLWADSRMLQLYCMFPGHCHTLRFRSYSQLLHSIQDQYTDLNRNCQWMEWRWHWAVLFLIALYTANLADYNLNYMHKNYFVRRKMRYNFLMNHKPYFYNYHLRY